MTQQYSDADLVARYIQVRDFLEKEAAEQAKHVEPYATAMQAIEGELHRRLLERNPNWKPGMKASGNAGGGTFFLKTGNSTKVADRGSFHDFVFETNAREFLTAHVAKEAVEEYMKEHDGALPPGITVDTIVKLQVRKT